MLTIFTVPKAFQGEVALLQRNAFRSWKEMKGEVQILLLGDEVGHREAAVELGASFFPVPDRAPGGAPLLSAVFARAREEARHGLLCYVNSDILLMDDFLAGVQAVAKRLDRFLIVGQRWDLAVKRELQFTPGWESRLREEVARQGKPHRLVGSDYFVFPADSPIDMPPFAVGRAGWDNWMIFAARRRGTPVVDASASIQVIHQDHDYSHLPGGQPHHRHPESLRNLALAGGRETIFRLRDADWVLTAHGPVKKTWRDWEWPRKLEADLTLRVGPGRAARLVWMAFHPLKTLRSLLSLGETKGTVTRSSPEVEPWESR